MDPVWDPKQDLMEPWLERIQGSRGVSRRWSRAWADICQYVWRK